MEPFPAIFIPKGVTEVTPSWSQSRGKKWVSIQKDVINNLPLRKMTNSVRLTASSKSFQSGMLRISGMSAKDIMAVPMKKP